MFRYFLLILWFGQAYAADVLLIAKGDPQRVITQDAYPEMRFAESQLTQTTVSMLVLHFFQHGISVAIDDHELAASLSQQGLPIEDAEYGCTIALELHFDPQHQPDGAGEGLWIASDESARRFANEILTYFAASGETVYRDHSLSTPSPESRAACPILYINLDSQVQSGQRLWFIHPQSIMNYSGKLAAAVTKALQHAAKQ